MKYNKLLTILSTLFLTIISCSSLEKTLIPTYNQGGYKLIYNTSDNSPDVYISGKVFDVSNDKPISNVQLSLGCHKFETSTNGEFNFKVKKSEYSALYLIATTIGYKTVETNYINLNKGNKIKVDFYLFEDDRPFINCEGIN